MTSPARPHRVLVVEDQHTVLETLRRVLTRRGYDVTCAASAPAATLELEKELPDIILLDIFMPNVSGMDLLRVLRENERTKTIPLILVSGLSDTDHIVEGLKNGANDYVTKPIVFPILLARMEALLRGAALVKQLEVQTELLARQAAFDELTGTYNRRSLFHALETEISRAERYGRALSIVMLDIDHFKRVNDEHGHVGGDGVLREFAQRAQALLRAMDTFCRYGGEEFCAILPETRLSGAVRATERVRTAIAGTPFKVASAEVWMTVSAGICAWEPNVAKPDLIESADKALLEAKRTGRNRICVFGQTPETAP